MHCLRGWKSSYNFVLIKLRSYGYPCRAAFSVSSPRKRFVQIAEKIPDFEWGLFMSDNRTRGFCCRLQTLWVRKKWAERANTCIQEVQLRSVRIYSRKNTSTLQIWGTWFILCSRCILRSVSFCIRYRLRLLGKVENKWWQNVKLLRKWNR